MGTSTKKLLLVEDNPDHAELIEIALRESLPEFHIETVPSGDQCLSRLQEGGFDIIVLDYSLPGMNGLQVMDEMRKKGYQLPFVVVTGRGNETVAVEAMKKGAYDYIVKSENYLTALPLVVKKALEKHELTKELTRRNRELEAVRSEFISIITHELRTPLNGIIGYAELLKDGFYGELEEEQKQALQNIIACGRHLLDLIDEILEMSRFPSESIRLNRELCSVYDIIEAVATTIKPLVQQRNLQLIINCDKNLPPLYIDPQRIYQILLNIAGNAVKFTEQGRIEIGAINKGDQIEFYVQDTGVGIARDKIDKVFDYGQRGLGLRLSKRLVELHNGRIWVNSEVDKGTTFHFTLPVGETLRMQEKGVSLSRGFFNRG